MKHTPRRVFRVAGWVLATLVAYSLSIGPVLQLTVDTRFESAADAFYQPLFAFGDTRAWPLLREYLRIWGAYHQIEDSTPIPRPI
jgi:hypothetical protein